jgi:predicted nuclease of predicted toxin-antitoxin system
LRFGCCVFTMTKFLVDECVNQKSIRQVPVAEKGFDVVKPQDRSFSGAADASIAKLAREEERVLVTCDSDFSRLNFVPNEVPAGILWLHPRRSSKKAIDNLLSKFCRQRLQNFSPNPYNFSGQIIEVNDTGVRISTTGQTNFVPWPTDHSD